MKFMYESNPAFNKRLFLQSLYRFNKPVQFKVLKLGNIFKSKMNGKPSFFLELEILTDFPDCEIRELDSMGNIQENDDGSIKTIKINAKDEIIGFPYELKPSDEPELYDVSNRTNLFAILNKGFIEKGRVKSGNQRGFYNVSYDEIKEALTGLVFWGKAVLVKETSYTPYFKLMPVLRRIRE